MIIDRKLMIAEVSYFAKDLLYVYPDPIANKSDEIYFTDRCELILDQLENHYRYDDTTIERFFEHRAGIAKR